MTNVAQNRDSLDYWVEFIKRRITPGFSVTGPYSNDADLWYAIGSAPSQDPAEAVPKVHVGLQMKDARFFHCRPGERRTVLGTHVETLQTSGIRELTKLGML